MKGKERGVSGIGAYASSAFVTFSGYCRGFASVIACEEPRLGLSDSQQEHDGGGFPGLPATATPFGTFRHTGFFNGRPPDLGLLRPFSYRGFLLSTYDLLSYPRTTVLSIEQWALEAAHEEALVVPGANWYFWRRSAKSGPYFTRHSNAFCSVSVVTGMGHYRYHCVYPIFIGTSGYYVDGLLLFHVISGWNHVWEFSSLTMLTCLHNIGS